jgi:glycine/D-amino acid oxidase-like deaminating enzyme
MKTRYGVSPWILEFPDSRRPDRPPLRGEHTADVVIVGGGLAGCATAYACASAGLKTILLEGDRLGQGSAGRSAGLLLPEPGPAFRDVAAAHGLRSARKTFEGWRRASLEGAALLRRLKIRCALEPVTTLTVAGRETEKLLRRELDARVEAGLDASWLNAKQASALSLLESPAAALRQRDAFAIDPYRACLGLASAAAARKARLFERTRVKKVTFTRRDATVITGDAAIRTGKVVVTTGTATAEWSQLRRHFTRRDTYLVMTEPVPAAVRKQVAPHGLTFRDTHMPRRRVRWTADDRLLIAGADQDTPPDRQRAATLTQRTGQLMYELLTMYPAIAGLRPAYGWDLAYGETADGLMYIGPHRNYPHHLFALGGPSDSITGAFLAARILARAVQDASEKDDQVFGFTR